MQVTIKTVPRGTCRANQAGDYFYNEHSMDVLVDETGNEDINFLVAMHELVEAYLCRKSGVDQDAILQWDLSFSGDGEPGDDIAAPYHKQHQKAESIERTMAVVLGVKWSDYIAHIDKLEAGDRSHAGTGALVEEKS